MIHNIFALLNRVLILRCRWALQNLQHSEILKVGSAFHNNCIPNLLMSDHMVMPTKYQVYSIDLIDQFGVVVTHHMSECYDDVTFLFLLEHPNHLDGIVHKVQIVAPGQILDQQCVQPLLLSQTENANPDASPFKDPKLLRVSQPIAGLLIIHIAEKPGEVGEVLQLHDHVQLEVKVMIAEARSIDTEGIQWLYHMLAVVDVGKDRRREHVAGEQGQGVRGLVLVDPRQEGCHPADWLFVPRLEIVHVVEVDYPQQLFVGCCC